MISDIHNVMQTELDGKPARSVRIIREFSIAVNVPLVNVVERMSARNVGSTAHYVFVH